MLKGLEHPRQDAEVQLLLERSTKYIVSVVIFRFFYARCSLLRCLCSRCSFYDIFMFVYNFYVYIVVCISLYLCPFMFISERSTKDMRACENDRACLCE